MIAFDFFDGIAIFVIFALVCTAAALIVVLGSLPGWIATKRGHPQAKAIAAAGWISLATLFALWPIAFVWAFLQPWSGRSTPAEERAP